MTARLSKYLHRHSRNAADTLGLSLSELARRGMIAAEKGQGVADARLLQPATRAGVVMTLPGIDAPPNDVRRGLAVAVETCEGAMFPQSWELQLAIKKFKKACLRSARVDVGRVLAKVREVSG